MTNPWDILGWAAVGVAAGFVLICVLLLVAFTLVWTKAWYHVRFVPWTKYRKTRDIAPAAGQIWIQPGAGKLHIKRISKENGTIVIEVGRITWGEAPEKWKQRVKNRKLYLIQPESAK